MIAAGPADERRSSRSSSSSASSCSARPRRRARSTTRAAGPPGRGRRPAGGRPRSSSSPAPRRRRRRSRRRINATHGRPFTIVVDRDGKRVVARPAPRAARPGRLPRRLPDPGRRPGPASRCRRRRGKSVRDRRPGDVADTSRAHRRARPSARAPSRSRARSASSASPSDAYRQSLQDFLAVARPISLALALLNLLPVLPLDGGHIVMSILERIRGRAVLAARVPPLQRRRVTLFVFLLYLGLRNDLFSGGS